MTVCEEDNRVPNERLGELREIVADVLEVEPEDGEHLATLIAKIYATPKPIIERVGNLIK